MPPRIYPSTYPPVHVGGCSVFTHLFPRKSPHDDDHLIFADAETKTGLTLRELRQKSLELAWGLRNVLRSQYGGVQLTRGDTILVFSPNTVAYPLVVLGAFAAGLRTSLANSAYNAEELQYQYQDSGAKAIFCHPSLTNTVMEMLNRSGVKDAKSRIIIASWGPRDKRTDGFLHMENLLSKRALDTEEKFDGELAHETALLCYSSGTTGKPKGVETTHANLVSVMNMTEPVLPLLHKKDVLLGVLPFYHIYGCLNMFHATWTGVTTVVMTRFEPVAFCRSIAEYKVTLSFIVPPILVVLARHPAVEKFDFRSLRLLVSGAAPLSASLTKAVVDRLKSRGANTAVSQGYGLTETSPTAHVLQVEDAFRKMGSVGRLHPNLEARLVGEDGEDVPEGQPGELWLRGPSIMKGYLNKPEETRQSITPDRWFQTGDIATIDDEGFFYIVDRKKELIKYKGFQVPPAELEALLLQHPDISDAGVVGVESQSEATELPRAYIVPAKTFSSENEKKAFAVAVQDWVKARVARHKYLRGGVVLVNEVPKSAAGKILRRQLRDRARKEYNEEQQKIPKAKL